MALILSCFDQLVTIMHITNLMHLFRTNNAGKESSFVCFVLLLCVNVVFAWVDAVCLSAVIVFELVFFDTTEIVIEQLKLCAITSNFLTFFCLQDLR